MKHSSYFHHHHHRCSDLRQVPGTHSLHSFLLSALLFIFTNEPSIRSSIIPLLGLPRGLFPNILPSNISLSSPSPLSTCPIQFFFLWYIVLMRHLFSFTIDEHLFITLLVYPPPSLHTNIVLVF